MNRETDCNLYSLFREAFPADLNKTLLETESGAVYRYADIDNESARLASFLTARGLKVGDRVTVQVEKSPQALCLYLACLRGGFVYHPLNSAYQRSELEYFIANAQPSLVICDPSDELLMGELIEAIDAVQLMTLDADGGGSLISASRDRAAEFATVKREPDDLAALLYSSGTTGRPKGIMLTHGNLATNARTLVDAWGFDGEDCLLHALPIFHVHGLFVAISCVLMSGASMRWLRSFDAAKVIEALPECTVMMGVPTFYTRLLARRDFTREVCRNNRLFISGSAPLLEEVFNAFVERTDQVILERYGMTETGMNTSNPLRGERRAGTVGPSLPGVEVRVVDADLKRLGCDEIGDLQVRGANVFKGYWRMPEKTAEDFTSDGFFNTGDKAVIDSDNYVSIVGRSKDMIISGGLNIYPKEIEAFIDELKGVLECAVIGVPHRDFGEGVVAVVVRQDGENTLSDIPLVDDSQIISATKKELANFKVPKKVFFVDELPRNTMGKVQKKTLRERYADALN